MSGGLPSRPEGDGLVRAGAQRRHGRRLPPAGLGLDGMGAAGPENRRKKSIRDPAGKDRCAGSVKGELATHLPPDSSFAVSSAILITPEYDIAREWLPPRAETLEDCQDSFGSQSDDVCSSLWLPKGIAQPCGSMAPLQRRRPCQTFETEQKRRRTSALNKPSSQTIAQRAARGLTTTACR